MDEFMRIYEEYKGSRPMNMIVRHIDSGIPRWRLHIFEKGTAPAGGDMEILCIEKPTKEECLGRCAEILKERIRNEQKAKEKAV